MMNLWQNNFDTEAVKPPTSVLEWLQTKTSITEKAKKSCKDVHLEVLSEHWISNDEAHDINANDDYHASSIFVREINMFCDNKIAWYARTWIPKKTYDLRAEKFQSLHEQPLGKILYNDPDIIREDFVYAYLNAATLEYQWAIKHDPSKPAPAHLWARKSTFRIDGEPLYLMEVFFDVP